MAADRLMLVDTASLYFRAFHGIPKTVTSPDGRPVNAVRGLLDFLAKLVGDHRPTHLACCWDEDWRPAWRVALLPSYKAHRLLHAVRGGQDVEVTPPELDPQVPVIRAVLDAAGIAVVGAEHYEADDVIGALAARARMPVDVVSGDRDLLQVVDDARSVRVLYTGRGVGRLVVADEAWVLEHYGVPPRHYVDFAVLRGDPSDGLPGVAGVGDRTAASLVSRHGDLAHILAAAEDDGAGMAPVLRAKLRGAFGYLAVAPKVVRVATDVPLADLDLALPAQPSRPADFAALVERWGLGSAAARLLRALAPGSG